MTTKAGGRLRDRVALVTGAGSGIGAATARRLAGDGAAVALVGRTRRGLDEVAADIRAAGGRALAVVADISVERDADAAVQATVDAFGALHVAFNNAGVLGRMLPIAEMAVADFDAVIDTNLRGTWLMARAEIRAMRTAGIRGSIVNTSSFVARAAGAGTSAYAASKAGLDAIARALALEVGGDGIRVNNVAPGVVDTDMFRSSGVDDATRDALAAHAALKRLGQAGDIARVVAWLASDDAAFVTGQSLLVDGGFTIPGQR